MLLTGFLIGSSSLLPPGGLAGHEAWLANVIAVGLGVAFALLYAWLAQRFPRVTMVEIARRVYGRVLGTIIAALYVVYVFHLGSLILTDYTGFFTTQVYSKTPQWTLIVLLATLAGFAAWSGIEPLARAATLLVPVIVGILALDTVVLLSSEFELRHLLPLFETPLPKLLWATFAAYSFPYAEIVVFLMIMPSLHRPREGRRWIVSAVLTVGIIFTLITIRNAGSLGRALTSYPYPSFAALRQVNIGDFLTRLESSIAVVLLAAGFVKLSALYYASTVGFAQVLRLKDYRTLIIPVGILLALFGAENFLSVLEDIEWSNTIYPLWASIFQIIIPVTTAIIVKVRGLPRPGPDPSGAATDLEGAGQSLARPDDSRNRPQAGRGQSGPNKEAAGQARGGGGSQGATQASGATQTQASGQAQASNSSGTAGQQSGGTGQSGSGQGGGNSR